VQELKGKSDTAVTLALCAALGGGFGPRCGVGRVAGRLPAASQWSRYAVARSRWRSIKRELPTRMGWERESCRALFARRIWSTSAGVKGCRESIPAITSSWSIDPISYWPRNNFWWNPRRSAQSASSAVKGCPSFMIRFYPWPIRLSRGTVAALTRNRRKSGPQENRQLPRTLFAGSDLSGNRGRSQWRKQKDLKKMSDLTFIFNYIQW